MHANSSGKVKLNIVYAIDWNTRLVDIVAMDRYILITRYDFVK